MKLALFGLGVVVMASMAIAAHSLPYFPGDIAISHTVQAYRSDGLDSAFDAVSWTGFPPQGRVLFGVVVVFVLLWRGLWAAIMEAGAALGSGALYVGLEPLVARPRPSPDLVWVAYPIPMTSFPSGHLLTVTAVFGFLAYLAYLAYRQYRASTARWLPVVVVASVIVLMAVARIYSGQHWASDVLAGCLLGLLWLAVVVRVYAWGEVQFSRRPRYLQPLTAPAARPRIR